MERAGHVNRRKLLGCQVSTRKGERLTAKNGICAARRLVRVQNASISAFCKRSSRELVEESNEKAKPPVPPTL